MANGTTRRNFLVGSGLVGAMAAVASDSEAQIVEIDKEGLVKDYLEKRQLLTHKHYETLVAMSKQGALDSSAIYPVLNQLSYLNTATFSLGFDEPATADMISRDVQSWNNMFETKIEKVMKYQLDGRHELISRENEIAQLRFGSGYVSQLDLFRPQEVLIDLDFLYKIHGLKSPVNLTED